MQIQGMQQQGQLGQLKMDEYRSGLDRTNRLNQLLSQEYETPEAMETALTRGGYIEQAGTLATNRANAARAKTDAAKANEEISSKRLDRAIKSLGVIRDASIGASTFEGAAAIIDAMYEHPDLKGSPILAIPKEQWLPKGNDPASLDLWKKEFSLGSANFIKENAPKVTTESFGGTKRMLERPGLGGAPQVIYEAPMTMTPDAVATDKRQREEGAANRQAAEDRLTREIADKTAREQREKPGQFLETADGFVLANPRTGGVTPVMGADGKPLRGKVAEKGLNETQAKANLFGTRMQAAHATLTALEDQGVTNSGLIKGTVQGVAGLTPFMGEQMSDAAGSIMNVVPGALGGPSSAQQRVEQSRRDFVNAVLRRESGAAIAPSEFANAQRQYFPQPGDSKEVIAQKRRNRELAIRGLEVEVPGGFRGGAYAGNGRALPGQAASGSVLDAADAILRRCK
jgi:hypothetical protein